MSFATESVIHHNAPMWLLKFTDGATTLRYSSIDFHLLGVGMVEGRVSQVSPCALTLETTLDQSGSSVTIIDPTGSVAASITGPGWKCFVQYGYRNLDYADWKTFAVYDVLGKPFRAYRTITLQLVNRASTLFGRMQNLPQIQSGDAYLFTALNMPTWRDGEILPMFYGAWGNPGGAIEMTWLGYELSSSTLVYLIAAQSKAHSTLATTQVTAVFLNGIELIDLPTLEVNADGNFELLVAKFTVLQASKLGIIDGKVFSDGQKQLFGPRLKVSQTNLGFNARAGREEIRQRVLGTRKKVAITCNYQGPHAEPIDLIEQLVTFYGPGADYISLDTDGAADYMGYLDIVVSVDIKNDGPLYSVIDSICNDVGIEQAMLYSAVTDDAQLHAYWPHNVNGEDSLDEHAYAKKYSDLGDFTGTQSFVPGTSGNRKPISQIQVTTPVGEEVITDSQAIIDIGASFERMSTDILRCVVLSRVAAWHRIQTRKEPRSTLESQMSPQLMNDSLADYIKATVRGGPSLGGWIENRTRLRRIELDLIGNAAVGRFEDREQLLDKYTHYIGYADEDGTIFTFTLSSCLCTSGDSFFYDSRR